MFVGGGCFPRLLCPCFIPQSGARPTSADQYDSGQLTLAASGAGEQDVPPRFGFVIDFHDAIQHPVGWRFAGLRGVKLDVGDRVAKERQLSVAWALWQDDEPCVQLGVRAEPYEVGVVVRDEHELLAD